MIRRKRASVIAAALASAMLLTLLGGCGRSAASPEQTGAALHTESVGAAEAAGQSASGRKDGERFEEVIILEGMEETVRYEHVRNDAIGIEIDYDYKLFERRSGALRECFVSCYDRPDAPENYLELTYSPADADSAAASVRALLSRDYELLEGTRELEGAGSCLRIEASVIKGTNRMADQIQVVYIIPASDGCRVAAAHYAVEAAEGFGRRFAYFMNTLSVIGRNAEGRLTDGQALSAVKRYCCLSNPDLAGIVNAGDYPAYWEISSSDENQVVVLFRSYTGAQLRYYIDRASGETSVTEFVPGVSSREEQTEERFSVREYLFPLTGTWQTASVGYEAEGTVQPEYYVRFTDAEIVYGHMKGGAFSAEYSDRILFLEETASGGAVVKAVASNGVLYSYRTSVSDQNVLEYYKTWREEDYPVMYLGGASLSRCA